MIDLRLSRRSFVAGTTAFGTAVLGGAADRRAMAQAGGPLVVELFTSQGCNSCPPADAYLGQLARRSDIVALSFHVDYWDYIGWKDPFASRATTDRQRSYAEALRQRYVYTPEMVVDGMAHDTGRDPAAIEALLVQARRRSAQRPTPEFVRESNGAVSVRLAGGRPEGGLADVWLVAYDRRHSTRVARGENGGRTLDNFNVVRRLESLGAWDGTPRQWSVSADRIGAGQGIAILIQKAGFGPMIGAARWEPSPAG